MIARGLWMGLSRLSLFAAALLAAAPASAETPEIALPRAPAPLDPVERLALAKDLFRRGVALLNAGDFEGALDFFLRSRAFVPSSPNTKNAAICLERLGRDDEALSMYEELLRSFRAELNRAEQDALEAVLHTLGQKVGSLRIAANVDGQVIVDGRDRGRLPLLGPIHVRGPRHVLQIAKEGYAPFEMVVDVGPGALVAVDARLRPLAGLGLPRVEAPGGGGGGGAADVFLDGRRMKSSAFLRGRSFVNAFGGYAGSPGLHGSASLGCPGACGASPRADGFLLGLRSGYRLGMGFAPELAGGYMAFGSSLSSLRGLFIGAGMSYRVAPRRWLGLLLRTTAGILSAETGAGAAVAPAQPFFVMPELGAEGVFGGLHVGVQLGLGFFPSESPVLPRDSAPGEKVRPYGAFLLWVPQIGAAYSFD